MLRQGGSTAFGPDMEKITKCRKLHNELLNTSQNIINSQRMEWAVHVARRRQNRQQLAGNAEGNIPLW